MPAPTRIIIDIKDTNNFDWDGAHNLWKHYFRAEPNGMNDAPYYVWYKVNPDTNVPIEPLGYKQGHCIGNPPGSPVMVDRSPEIAELREEIDAVRKAVYKLKREKPHENPIVEATKNACILDAMEGATRKLYSRWNALDEENRILVDVIGVPTKKKYKVKNPSPLPSFMTGDGTILPRLDNRITHW